MPMKGFEMILNTTLIFASLFQIVLSGKPLSPKQNYETSSTCHRDLTEFSDFTILSTYANHVQNFSAPAVPGDNSQALNLNFQNITLVLTHGTDVVYVWLWLPTDGWNGRFLVAGGGGLSAGDQSSLVEPVSQGFAAASTDAGLTLNNTINPQTGVWGITEPGVLNDELVKNFAYRSIHDVVTVGKALVESCYGSHPQQTYYSGCSTGGRQGYFAAQRYPEDFDGIMANAPALYTPKSGPGAFWPSVVMRNIEAPPMCVFEAYRESIVATCDGYDGVVDGIISRADKCDYDTSTLIGKTISCEDTGSPVTITDTYAEVVQMVLQGPENSLGQWLWYGVPLGAPFSGLARTVTNGNTTIPVPFSPTEAWMRYFVFLDPTYNTANMSFADFQKAYDISVDTFTNVLGTEDVTLSRFREVGGKLLTWHGLADPIITPEGSLRYRRDLEKFNGGAEQTNEFHRLFLAPGVDHCRGGVGPVPVDPMDALMDWVENGVEPDSLRARTGQNGSFIARDLCPYPQVQTYIEGRNPNITDSFYCA